MITEGSENDLFLKNVYPEIKDLGKQFVTLVSGILAFTVTFADKVIDFEKALLIEKLALLASWGAFVAAIAAVGWALWDNYNASMQALHQGIDVAWSTTYKTYRMFRVGAYSFGIGLICLVLAASIRMLLH